MHRLAESKMMNHGSERSGPSEKERVAKSIVSKYDADQDGTLNKDEILSLFDEYNKDGRGLDSKKITELLQSLKAKESIEAEGDEGGSERDKLLNDVMNTGIAAALVGGFALGNIQESDRVSENWMDIALYMLSFVAVHACTCSCLTSAMFYRVANMLRSDEVLPWMKSKAILLKLPWYKFAMGCASYILAVIVLAFRALENLPFWRYAALVIGIMSMSTVVASLILIGQKVGPLEAHTLPKVGRESSEGGERVGTEDVIKRSPKVTPAWDAPSMY